MVNTSSFLNKFLLAASYRAARHVVMVSILVIIALNQTFMTLREGLDIIGCRVFFQFLFIFTSYLFVCYFNFYVLLPRYLLKKKYSRYLLYFNLIIFLLITFQTLEERSVLVHYKLLYDFYNPPRIYFMILSSYTLVLLCMSGGAITILLKNWIKENEKVSQLEKLHMESKVEQLKEQVSPSLLFKVLHYTGGVANHHPEEASDLIIRLSRLLRYQLYDCSRDKVLLSSEIKFLHDYLTLEQLCSQSFEFSIRSDKNNSLILVSPLLFISFVQSTVNEINQRKEAASLQLIFKAEDDKVIFSCYCESECLFPALNFMKACQRLELLYPKKHSLSVVNNRLTLELNL